MSENNFDRPISRRAALALGSSVTLGGLLAACAKSTPSSDTNGNGGANSTVSPTTSNPSSSGAEIPTETLGPFPADGSNGPNVLTDGAIERADLTRSFGSMSGTAEGIPTAIQLTLVDAVTGSALAGAAVYLWHCTATGKYSIYEVSNQNYLRGIQVADEFGRITFNTVYPGCYGGRWPHCHFEIFESLEEATSGGNARKTTQLALPEAESRIVYRDSRYGNSGSNLDRLSLTSDMVFRDGWTSQLATVSGDNSAGYTVALTVRT